MITLSDRTKLPIEAVIIEISMAFSYAALPRGTVALVPVGAKPLPGILGRRVWLPVVAACFISVTGIESGEKMRPWLQNRLGCRQSLLRS